MLQAKRIWQDLLAPPSKLKPADPENFPFLIAESITPLFNDASGSERSLQLGKIQNLRKAMLGFSCVELPANATFSFWKQIRRATSKRGFVEGRQILEGCLVPAIGGGLCQLSNALYDVSLKAGLEIVERHPHSRIVPGSAAAEGRDATVFWNYIDLRFRSDQPLMISARLDQSNLVVPNSCPATANVLSPDHRIRGSQANEDRCRRSQLRQLRYGPMLPECRRPAAFCVVFGRANRLHRRRPTS